MYKNILSIVAVLVATFALIFAIVILQGASSTILSDPYLWARTLDPAIAFDIVSTASELLAAVLAIAITVVAIVVELASNRYSHRITSLFVREPINIIVMSFFVIATIHSLWVALTLNHIADVEAISNAGLLTSMIVVTVSLVILLPYFAFVLSFLSPISVISKIQESALESITNIDSDSSKKAKNAVRSGIDELQDIARRASELNDRAVAMASINALLGLLIKYQTLAIELPRTWFDVTDFVTVDPDFVSLSESTIREIEKTETWVEVKVMRQYLDLISDSNSSSRDTTYLIAINTKEIGIVARDNRPQLLELCIRCFNSYLRTTINNQDARTGYYIMNQYRMLGEHLLQSGEMEVVNNIAFHLQFYGLLGFRSKLPFLLEVAAYDVAHLIEECILLDSTLVDSLLDLLLEFDQEIKEEYQEESLIGVRRAQVQLATHFLNNGDEKRALRICDDLKYEKPERLAQIREVLMSENREQYWEFTDRGLNFSYLSPKLRLHLDTLFKMIDFTTPRKV
jgi:hypothetical protein